MNSNQLRSPKWLACFSLGCLLVASSARAFIDLAPTLTKVLGDAQRVSLVEVTAFDPASHVVTLKEIRALKGAAGSELIRHEVASEGGVIPSGIQQWAEPGARGVLFVTRATALLCYGEGWYQARASGGAWKLGVDRPDLPLAYYGTVSRLADGIANLLAGRSATLTMVQHGAEDAASFDLALHRMNLPGVIRVQRIRASTNMPGTVMAMSANAAYVIGIGTAGEEDLPALREQLDSPDAGIRAEAAGELRQLGRKALPARETLAKLLGDPAVHVRLAAASTLLSVTGEIENALKALEKGLTDSDPAVRRHAARAVGLAGRGAAPLVGRLVPLLKDSDTSVRSAAIQAVATLGPVAAAAKYDLAGLLDDSRWRMEAADALGRLGPAAQPAPPRLATMLATNEPVEIRWAAVRALAQIGGQEAHPAVEYIVKALPGAQEIDAYNMLVYLSLLGPVAKDAVDAVRNAQLGHPILPSATIWAIQQDTLPWAGGGGRGFGGRRGGFGGRGGGPGPGGPGGMGFDLASTMYEAYFRELGERLHPVALLFLNQIVDGTAKDVPVWGYKLLGCAERDAVGKLSPMLASNDLATRERATVALGYLKSAGLSAKAQVQAAADHAPTEREQRLLQWCLREISSE